MPIPNPFLDFPNANSYTMMSLDFNSPNDLIPWDWNSSGHLPPDATDTASSRVTLGGVDATDESYLNGQTLGGGVLLNRLSKTFYVEFMLSIDSGTLCECLIGLNSTNTNMLNTCIADGMGFYINGPAGPATGFWHVYNASGAVTQYTDYGGYATTVAGDTSTHTFAMKIITDSTTIGKGQVTYFIDGNAVGNGLSGTILTSQPLRLSVAMGNGTAVARTVQLYRAGYMNQR